MIELEARSYGENSTEEEIEAIRARVYMYSDNIVYWKEVPVMSVWQVQQYQSKMKSLTNNLKHYALLIDLTESKPPNAEIRASLRDVYGPFAEEGLDEAAVFTGKNFLINVAAKFVLGGVGLKKFTVHSKQEDALKALSDYA
ncbi:MAG: hypothetical protein COA44_14955 [Arcobacter sp.]|nr:MAG: hypothetical protein COA44_14955 [Arcobacter sp.]